MESVTAGLRERYDRQLRFRELGTEGQQALARGLAVVIGVGAVGGAAALLLARAGVGRLRLVDPDRVALDNLHRQVLYDEGQAFRAEAKVAAAAASLNRGNGTVEVEARTVGLDEANGPALAAGAGVVIDGLDNQADRYHLNRACVGLGITWIHAAATAARANVRAIRPGLDPCFQCLHPHPESADTSPPTLTQGIIGPAALTAGAMAAALAIRTLIGRTDNLPGGHHQLDLWTMTWKQAALKGARRADCPVCGGL